MRLKLARWKKVSIAFIFALCLCLSIAIPATQRVAHAIGEKYTFDDSTGTITVQGGNISGIATLENVAWISCDTTGISPSDWCFQGSVTIPGVYSRENAASLNGSASCIYTISIMIIGGDLQDDNGTVHIVANDQKELSLSKTIDLSDPSDGSDGQVVGNCKGDHSIITNSPGGTLGIITSPGTIPVLSSGDAQAQKDCQAQDGIFDGVTKACALPICDPVSGVSGVYIVGAPPGQSCAYPKASFPGGTCPAGMVDGAASGKADSCLGGSRIPSAGSLTDTPTTEDKPDLCPIPKGAGLRWAYCPVILAGQYITDTLDSFINYMLTVDTTQIFGTATGKNGNIGDPTGGHSVEFYHVWSLMRNLGIGLVIIAGLIMVMSELLGLEIVDAYTIRKILPRLIIGVIGIAISWYLCYYIITFFNKLGHGVSSLIYSSFSGLQSTTSSGFTGGSIFAQYFGIAAGAVGGLVALGALGIISFLGTIILALAVGVLILVLREGIVIMCVIIAPLAIASYILPNTSKFASFWWNTFIKSLMAFPIITGFLAISKVMALITRSLG